MYRRPGQPQARCEEGQFRVYEVSRLPEPVKGTYRGDDDKRFSSKMKEQGGLPAAADADDRSEWKTGAVVRPTPDGAKTR